MYYNKIKNGKTINIGLQVLRFLLSFWVVVIHSYYFIGKQKIKKHLNEKMFHVPTFMFISFYFFFNYLAARDNLKIFYRLKRLLIPYFIWPFIYLVLNNSVNKMFGVKNFKRKISLKDYCYQIILSERYYASFWYLNVLLFLSIFFTIISYIFKKDFLFIIQLIGFFTYFLHYSGIYNILRKHGLFRLCFVLIIQITPAAVIGLTVGSTNLIVKLKPCYVRILIIFFLSLICLFSFPIFQPHDGFLYQKVELNTLGSFNLFIFFSSLPFENITSNKINFLVKLISYYTGGIYYIHNFTRSYLVKIIKPIKKGTFSGSIILYIICHFICFFGNKIFEKNSLKYLFI